MATRFHCLATDYDGTLAHDGIVEPSTVQALERLRASGRRLVMVTGRELEDLSRVFTRLDLFDHVVAENGAVLFTPATGAMRALADPPPPAFGDALAAAGVRPHVAAGTSSSRPGSRTRSPRSKRSASRGSSSRSSSTRARS